MHLQERSLFISWRDWGFFFAGGWGGHDLNLALLCSAVPSMLSGLETRSFGLNTLDTT